jgi:small subunit ribosomal protein S4e
MERFVKVDGKVRTDVCYPAGFMDVVSIEKSDEYFRLLYDTKGRMTVHRISSEEASYKLLKVKDVKLGEKAIPTLTTHDGRTIRYPDPLVKINDTILFDIESGKMKDFVRFDNGNVCMITGGHNAGRVGIILNREKHKGSNDIVHVKDSAGNTFATRIGNVFVIGKGNKPLVSIPKGKGIKLTILQEQTAMFGES